MDNSELKQLGSFVHRNCEGVSRRDAIKVGTLGFLGLTLPEFFALEAAQAQATPASAKPKTKADYSVIMLWMAGGLAM